MDSNAQAAFEALVTKARKKIKYHHYLQAQRVYTNEALFGLRADLVRLDPDTQHPVLDEIDRTVG